MTTTDYRQSFSAIFKEELDTRWVGGKTVWLLSSPHVCAELSFTMLLVKVGSGWLEVTDSSLDYKLRIKP